MKKLFLLASICLSISVFAEVQQKFVGDALTAEINRRNEVIKGITNNIHRKFTISVATSLLTANINTMDDVVANEAKVLATFTADEQKKIGEYYIPGIAKASFGPISWWFSNSLKATALKFYDSNNVTDAVLYLLDCNSIKNLGITNQEAYKLYSKYLLVQNSSADTTKVSIEKYIDICSNVDDTSEAKAVLKKLNMKYTKKLINDKATWEPIVALIRTTLEVL